MTREKGSIENRCESDDGEMDAKKRKMITDHNINGNISRLPTRYELSRIVHLSLQ